MMREYWLPAIRSDELPSPDCPPLRIMLLGESADRLPHDLRRRRPDAELLPPPRRVDVLRPQRRRGPALRLPRLEVRRRPATASTCRRSRPSRNFKNKVHAARLPDARAQRHHLGLHGPARGRRRRCPTSKPTCWPRARRRSPCCTASATGCRASRARWTPSTPPSCTAAPRTSRTSCPARFDYYHYGQRAAKFVTVETEYGTAYGAYRPGRGRHATTGASPRSSSRSTP